METPTLDTPRLRLRPATPADTPFVLTLFGRSETNQYSGFEDIATPAEAEEMYEGYLKPGFLTHFRVVAELKETGAPIGTIGLYLYSAKNRRAEIGYDMLKEHWGKGLMAEAVEEILRYGFEELNINRVEATTDSKNVASVHVLERSGFKQEGLLRERYSYAEGFHDELFFGLIASDWRRSHPQAKR
ncbi:MAG: GNAT family protein [Candidatus Bathyarchaeota archaeon]|nr:GNAT family protein [Candidatus Bathyarchaeota archaeon]